MEKLIEPSDEKFVTVYRQIPESELETYIHEYGMLAITRILDEETSETISVEPISPQGSVTDK